jgi:hypothetical protein
LLRRRKETRGLQELPLRALLLQLAQPHISAWAPTNLPEGLQLALAAEVRVNFLFVRKQKDAIFVYIFFLIEDALLYKIDEKQV